MRVLVTGSSGFVGRHACRELAAAGHEVIHFHEGGRLDGALIEIRDKAATDNAIRALRPDAVLHLAGIAFVPKAWDDPQLCYEVNLLGTCNIVESLRRHRPGARFLLASTAFVYGHGSVEKPLTEDAPLCPDNIYGVSKAAADLHCLLSAKRHNMTIMTARPSNHIGPGQSPDFVVSSFARQVADIRDKRQEPVMRVGNLDSERDFLDVRDITRAYRLILERGKAGEAYNLASGRFLRVRSLLDTLCSIAGISPKIEIDPSRYRPAEIQPALDISKAKADTGWQPAIKIEDTLADVLRSISAT